MDSCAHPDPRASGLSWATAPTPMEPLLLRDWECGAEPQVLLRLSHPLHPLPRLCITLLGCLPFLVGSQVSAQPLHPAPPPSAAASDLPSVCSLWRLWL